jgi:hypothetical protein
MNRYYTAKRIAAMIEANVSAVDSGILTWEQFGIVQRATWELAERGDTCSRRHDAVLRELRA